MVTLCLLVSRLSAVRSSNMSNSRWTAREISMALYWVYSCNVMSQYQLLTNSNLSKIIRQYFSLTSVLSLAWGLLHHTQLPTPAPVMARPFQIQRGANTDHHDQASTPSSLSVYRMEKSRREVNTTNLLPLNS